MDSFDYLNVTTGEHNKNYYKYDQYGENPMEPFGPVGIVGLKGTEALTDGINHFLVQRRREYLEAEPEQIEQPGFMRDDYHIKVILFRFSSCVG